MHLSGKKFGIVCAKARSEVFMKTGQTVEELGLYSTECCSAELVFDVGDTFSHCPRCQQLCKWEYEDEFVGVDPERLNGTAA